MASGKLSPRQKMINMMYLVLTAMLALNISKDILKALSKLDQGLQESVMTIENSNSTLYDALQAATATQPRAEPWNEKAKLVKAEAQEVTDYIGGIKAEIIEKSGGLEKGSDNRDVPQNILLNPENVGGKDAAKKIRQRLEEYKAHLIEMSEDNQTLIATVEKTFDFTTVPEKEGDAPLRWEEATFAELPLAGIVPFLTDLQARVRRTEADVVEFFYKQINAETIKFTTVVPVVKAKSTYVTQGSDFEAEVLLAAYDDTQDPVFELEGEALDESKVIDGVGHFSIPATGVGKKTWAGVVKLMTEEGEQPFDFTLEYTVAPPTAVISPTKMNVLYRQVENPLEISVPGVAPEKIRVSGAGIRGSNGSYIADVTSVSGTEMNISVSVEEEDGSVRSVGSKKFRIKGLPPAQTMIFGRSTSGPYSASAISNAPIQAAYQDFPFDLPLTVRSFQMMVPGEAPFNITGSSLTAAAKAAVQAARPGSTIIIRDVVATTQRGDRIRNISALTLDLN